MHLFPPALNYCRIHRFKLLTGGTDAAPDGDSKELIETRAFANGVLALPGTVFLPNGRPTPYVRASFSLTSEPDVHEALKRLRKAILDTRAEAEMGKK